MNARFEIVRTDAIQPWHARFRAGNGRIVWSTEGYWNERSALRAIRLIQYGSLHVDVKTIDERTERTS